METNRRMLTADEVSNVFFQGKVKTGKIYDMARQGELPSVKIGKRKLLFCLQDLNLWWEEQTSQQKVSGGNIRKLY